MYNKNEAAIHNDHSQYFEDLRCRHNVILMGDNVGDAKMAHGVPDSDVVLKIGFLNNDVSGLNKELNLYFQLLVYHKCN